MAHGPVRRSRLAVALISVVLTGCASRSLMQGARTLAPGESRLGANLVGGVAHDSTNDIPLGVVELGYRIGVTEGVDVGVRVWPVGARLDGKVRLYQDELVAVALDVGAFGAGFEQNGMYLFSGGGNATLITGLRVDASEIVIAAHIAPAYASGSVGSQSVGGLMVESGLLLGADLALGDVFHLMPEIGVLFRFGDQIDPISSLTRDPIVLHAGIGGYFHWTL